METAGVHFGQRLNKENGMQEDVFQITVSGNAENYLDTLRALLSLVGGSKEEFCDSGERYFICELIKDMLPSWDQIQAIKDIHQSK